MILTFSCVTSTRLADHLAGTFKVLFIKAHLAEIVLDAAPAILEQNNTLHTNATVSLAAHFRFM